MRGRDEETGEFLGLSRSQQRRDALAVLALAERLLELGDGQLAQVPMPEQLRELVRDSRRITAQIARKRQLQFLAKTMRKEDDEVIAAIRNALERDRDAARRDTAQLHQLEALRERLLGDGDTALAELFDQHPDADRQKLRQLVRNARMERDRKRPPHAFRELFRELKTLLANVDPLDGTDAATAEPDEYDFDEDADLP